MGFSDKKLCAWKCSADLVRKAPLELPVRLCEVRLFLVFRLLCVSTGWCPCSDDGSFAETHNPFCLLVAGTLTSIAAVRRRTPVRQCPSPDQNVPGLPLGQRPRV
jgi:hypothetical protein